MANWMPNDDWKPGLTGWSNDILPFYDRMAERLPAGAVCVELGVWAGRSLTFLHDAFQRRNKPCRLAGIDAWPNDYGFGGFDEAMAKAGGVYCWSLLQMLTHAPECLRDISLLRWDSADAAKLFADKSVDMVFIDAMHDYDHVAADIKAWLPKVVTGGIISGHDYSPSEYDGVIKAVDELVPNLIKPTEHSVWHAVVR